MLWELKKGEETNGTGKSKKRRSLSLKLLDLQRELRILQIEKTCNSEPCNEDGNEEMNEYSEHFSIGDGTEFVEGDILFDSTHDDGESSDVD